MAAHKNTENIIPDVARVISMDDTVRHQGGYQESFNLISLVEMCQEGWGPPLGVL